jgi:2-aminoadipate transaminase
MLRTLVRDARESPIRAMLGLAGETNMISLAGGHPDLALLPQEWLQTEATQVLSRLERRNLQYGATDGVASLRESICHLLSARRIQVDPDDVLVTTGSQQGISLLANVLIDAGDAVVMARYNYPAALQAFRFAGATVLDTYDDAANFEEIARHAAQKVKAIYLVPSFANPTGHCMSLDARMRLLRAATRCDVCIIEDDPYGELWFGRPPPDSLCSLNQQFDIGATVVYLTSFSKIVLPALRLGALIAPPALRRGAVLVKQAVDVHSGALEQLILDAMLRSGKLTAHLQRVRAAYERKAVAMADALKRDAHGVLTFHEPAGGMFVWAQLAADATAAGRIDWFAFGREHRVLALPGSAFRADGGPDRHIRLSFANPPLESIHTGVQRLARGLTMLEADTT